MSIYAFWNNKGGTGKTSLAFQSVCELAERDSSKRILVIDVCPQANVSELLLGGLMNGGSAKLLGLQGLLPRKTVGGYFQQRLPQPYQAGAIAPGDFIVIPRNFNTEIPSNIELLAGDPLLELQANAMSTLANNQIPGTNTWIGVVDWLRDFIDATNRIYDHIVIDANPSFSIYTQIALAASTHLVLPVMADDSSRRAVQNAFSLIYGLSLPSPIYTQHAFATRMQAAGRPLPQVHLIVKNRLTQYMGPASAYSAVLQSIDTDVEALMRSHGALFTFSTLADGFAEIRDFQTTGVAAFAKGTPFGRLPVGRITIGSQRVRLNRQYIDDCKSAVRAMVDRLG